ncbi:MAG: methylisocitrate lyase [Parachlamydiaceae bacterium]|nr:methylisocitrate lyase [Parachlamydiaceae bacterium]
MKRESKGKQFRESVLTEQPLQIVGVINAYVAMMAAHSGFKALYLSGAGIANSAFGLPDLGMTTLDNVAEEVRRITSAVLTPLLVDIDTGWGSSLMIARSIKTIEFAGAAAVHIEDQPFIKRCGHRLGKKVVPKEVMVDRIKAALDARTDPNFVIMARTDAYAIEGHEKTLERAIAYAEAGADMLFLEAFTELKQYADFRQHLQVPILANLTEFGQTPLFTLQELASAKIDMALYPLSANRAMNLAALKTLQTIRNHGTQKSLLESMQTREELYGFLNYESFEEQLEEEICQ